MDFSDAPFLPSAGVTRITHRSLVAPSRKSSLHTIYDVLVARVSVRLVALTALLWAVLRLYK